MPVMGEFVQWQIKSAFNHVTFSISKDFTECATDARRKGKLVTLVFLIA